MTETILLSATGAAATGAGTGLIMVVPYILIFIVFWFLLIRPQSQRAKALRDKVAAVKQRDQVVTAGGMLGKVTKVEDDFVDVEIAPNVRVRVVKSTLADVLPGGKPAND